MKPKPLQHNDQFIPYEIQHKPSVTRRIHLRAGPDGTLMVIAPKRMSKRAIHRTLQERAHKVARFLADALSRQQELPPRNYVAGEKHLFLGENFPLEIEAAGDRRGCVSFSEGRIRIATADSRPDTVKKLLTTWYRQQALEYFNERVETISRTAPWTSRQAPPIRLRKMKRTWGSCSSGGVITLNPQLIKTPPDCIDYVIAHEVCHLAEMNHGKAFYALQEKLYPAWREVRALMHSKSHIYLHE
jgi:predicted metal-dependent hydrolase